MGELRASSVARVRVKDGTGQLRRVGSGYLITPAVVLTAAHVLAGTSAQDVEVVVGVGSPSQRSIPAQAIWCDDSGGSDLAVIEIRADDAPVPAPVFGRVDRGRDAVIDCVAVGFPWWKRRTGDDGLFRESVRMSGTIAALSNLDERSLEMALDHGPPDALDPGRSPWEGASGAAVFAGEVIIGVVAEHYLHEGPMSLTVRPVEAAYRVLPADRLSELCRIAGMPHDATALVDVAAAAALTTATGAGRFAGSTASLTGDYAARIDNFLAEYLGTSSSPKLFAGRDRELARLSEWLGDDRAPPYQLVVAPGGRGKSALLVHWLAEVAGRGGCDIAFVPINSRFRMSPASVVFPAIAGRLAELHGTTLPPTSGWSVEEWRGIVSKLLTGNPPHHRLLVILDGVDEAEGWEIGPDLFPLDPPRGLRVLVSARTLAGDEGPYAWLDRLGWTDARLGAPPLLLAPLDEEGVAQLVASAGVAFGAADDRREAVSHLWRLTQGDALLLSLYMARLTSSAEDALDIESLPAMPAGLDGYFDRWWEDQRRIWGQRTPLREPAVRSVLTILSCVRGPITDDELLTLEPSLDSWTLDDVLNDLRRLVTGSGKQGLALTHPELSAYFAGRLAAQERNRWEQRFCDWGRAERQALASGTGSGVHPYLLQFWTGHLAVAHDRAELMLVIWDRRWYAAQVAADPSGASFANDVRLALAENESWIAGDHGDPADGLTALVRSALVASTLSSLSANIAPQLLEALVASGQWTVAQALTAVRRNFRPDDRVGGLLAMSRLSPSPGERDRLLLEALQEMDHIESDWTVVDQLEAWAAEGPGSLVAEALAQARERLSGHALVGGLLALSRAQPGDGAIVREAFGVACTLPESSDGFWPRSVRGPALVDVLSHATGALATTVANVAIDSARRCEQHDDRSQLLGKIAARVGQPLRDELVEEALRDAQVEDWEQGPAQALASLADVIPDRLLAEAFHAGLSISWPAGRVDVLVALAPRLAGGLLAEAAAAARKFPYAWWRDEAMVPIATRYAAIGDVEQALSLVSAMEQSVHSDKAMVGIVGALADRDPATAAALTGRLAHSWSRFTAWKALLDSGASVPEACSRLVGLISDDAIRSALESGNSGVRDTVIESARRLVQSEQIASALELLEALPGRDIAGGRPRGAAYARIVDLLSGDMLAEAARRALRSLEVIGDETEQVVALSGLASHVPEPFRASVVAHSLRLARSGLTAAEKAQRFSALLPSLDDATAEPVLDGELLQILPELEDYDRLRVWNACLPRLTRASLRSVLDLVADTDMKEPVRAWLLERAAPLLEDEQTAAALEHARDWPKAAAAIVPRLPSPQQGEMLAGLLESIEALPVLDPDGQSLKAERLALVAPLLNRELIPRAVAIVNSAASSLSGESGLSEYYGALSALAPRAAECGYHELALQLCRATAEYRRGWTLAQIVPYLPEATLAEAEEIAGTVAQVWRRDLTVALARRSATPLFWEAVYAAVTPDVWAGAGDLTGSLEDLAPSITPEVVATVLSHARGHPYPSVRAFAHAYLAGFVPSADQMAMYSTAVAEAESCADGDDRASILKRIAPLLPGPLLPRLVDAISGIPQTKYLSICPRAEALAAAVPSLLQLPAEDLPGLVRRIVRLSVTRPRKELLWDLSVLGPVLENAGRGALVETVARSVMQVADHWP
jgi:Trypsin-like peptidase domain